MPKVLEVNPSVLDEMLAQLDATMPEEVPPATDADIQRIVRDLDLTSCDFVGDSGCVDLDCWRCHSPLRPENLRTLARNLAAAAMLCRAWHLRDLEPAWRPGCRLAETDLPGQRHKSDAEEAT